MVIKRCFWLGVFVAMLFTTLPSSVSSVNAASTTTWWDEAWPYRVSVTTTTSGPVGVNLDFSDFFDQLGLVGALLDLRSIRVVPVVSEAPLDPIPYQETYSTVLADGETLIVDPSSAAPYWESSPQTTLTLDNQRFTEGSSAIHAEIVNDLYLDAQPGLTFHFNGDPISNWSAYESLIYSVWPEVNASALDQTPDIYQFEIKGLESCYPDHLNGPALQLNAWNSASVSLRPFGSCTTPDYSALESIRFYLNTQLYGTPGADFEDDDEVRLWLDDLRLVDQDGPGEIRWIAEEGIDHYDIYFDTLNHRGHPNPELTTVGAIPPDTTVMGSVESGGYFHQVTGADFTGLTIWNAPPVEKILRNQSAPVTVKPIQIHAGRGEFEIVQLVVQSEGDAELPIRISDLVNGERSISASQVSLFRVDYLPLTQLSDQYGRLTEWPDPLYPLSQGQTVHFPAGENQPIWLQFEVPNATPTGDFTGEIQIGSARVPFTLTVLDLSISSGAMLPTVVGIDWDSLLAAYNAEQSCLSQVQADLTAGLADYGLTPISLESGSPEGLIYTLTDYPVRTAQQSQIQSDTTVWWTFTGLDDPPLPNPAVIDRPGLDARILPWLAWIDRVDGLYYAQAADWDPNPWNQPFSNDLSNGDGFLIYPPNDSSIGQDPCDPDSNRIIPSIRLMLLREGLEDYAYLQRLSSGPPQIGIENDGDSWAELIIGSRTAFLRPPTALADLRLAMADALQSKQSAYYLPLFLY
ncbi:DUF4091 domain-containing protein [bacterium]|nr:DUF4091 domain-containing protein [bacterium]